MFQMTKQPGCNFDVALVRAFIVDGRRQRRCFPLGQFVTEEEAFAFAERHGADTDSRFLNDFGSWECDPINPDERPHDVFIVAPI